MPPFLLDLLLNKYTIGAALAIVAYLTIFFKGKSAGIASVESDERDAKDKLDSSIRTSEAKNQKIEKEKNDALRNDPISDDKSATSVLNTLDGGSPEDPKTGKR